MKDQPLYEKCDDCELGFVETGYTTGRLDRAVTEADQLLMLLDDLRPVFAGEATRHPEINYQPAVILLRLVLDNRAAELEAARSRSKPFAAKTENGRLILGVGPNPYGRQR